MTSYLAFGFFFGGYNVNIHLYMIHFWNTFTLRKVKWPTDVSRLNCVFERNGDMIPRAQLFVLWLPSNIALNINLKKRMSLYSLGRGRWGGGFNVLIAELYSIKMVNSTGEKSRVRVVITKWGAHIALLPVTSKIISINIHVHYIFLMTVIFQLLSICQK